MKESKYNITIEIPRSDKVVLYNTLYGTLSILNLKELSVARNIFNNSKNIIKNSMCNEIRTQLVKGKYLINNGVDELEILKKRKLLGIEDPNRLDVVIMPTMNCNFTCTYCYEIHSVNTSMTSDKESSIKLWLQKVVPGFKVMLLHWFGGEPLLNYERIITLGQYIKALCSKYRVELLTNITTNGYLFNEERIKELLGLGYYDYQITVDGSPNFHNKTRVLSDGSGTFKRVHQNIIRLAKANSKVKISLRINFNRDNIHSIPELLRMFPKNIRNQLRVVYEPIFGTSCISATNSMSYKEISSSLTNYYTYAEKLGYDIVHGSLEIGKLLYCYAERRNQYIINYNGDIFKCSVSTFNSEDRLGYINKDGSIIYENDKQKMWIGSELFDEICCDCKYLPLCMGGCRKARLERGDTGSYCNLIPTNVSYVLKTVALNSFSELVIKNSGKQYV